MIIYMCVCVCVRIMAYNTGQHHEGEMDDFGYELQVSEVCHAEMEKGLVVVDVVGCGL